MNHRGLLHFAIAMWAVPLVAATFVLLGFIFLRSPAFVTAGLMLLIVGGVCLTLGVLAVISVLATRNTFRETPRRYYKKKSLAVLGLLLANLPVAVAYTVLGGALLEPAALDATLSPSGQYQAEVVRLEETGQPPYGLAVTLRPTPGMFRVTARTVVFSAHCVDHPLLRWENDQALHVTCHAARDVGRRIVRYRDIALHYRLKPVEPDRARRLN